MFTASQIASALGAHVAQITCIVPLSPDSAPTQRCFLLISNSNDGHDHHNNNNTTNSSSKQSDIEDQEKKGQLAVIGLGRFELRRHQVSCVELQRVACSQHLTHSSFTEDQQHGVTVTCKDSTAQISAQVPFPHADAAATLLSQADKFKELAVRQNTPEEASYHWLNTAVADAVLREDQGDQQLQADRQSVKASQLNILLDQRRHEFVRHDTVHMLVTSWNVNGHLLAAQDDLAPLLLQAADADVVVMGFQELDLSTEALLRYSPERAQAYETHLKSTLNQFAGDFQWVTSKQLVGLFMVIFARSDFVQHMGEVHSASVATGPLGFANKGAVSVSMRIYESRVCFLAAHLPPFEDGVEQREAHLRSIVQKTQFPPPLQTNTSLGLMPGVSPDLARMLPEQSVFHADHLILLGDLNYRVTLANDKVRSLVTQNDFKTLLEHDQLKEVTTKGFLQGFQEAGIDWPPTYKFDKQSIDYDTSDKQRTPSYTDRILYRSALPLHPRSYRAHFEFGQSDHKPVSALYCVALENTDPERHRQAQQSVLEQLDKAENEQRPHAVCSTSLLEFPALEINESVGRETTLANTGRVPASWHLGQTDLKPWFHVDPQRGTLQPGDAVTIHVTAHITSQDAARLNSGQCTIEPELLILSVEGGPDKFLTVSTLEWQPTFLTVPMEVLVKIPEAVGRLTAEELKRCYTASERPALRQLPAELLSLTAFLVEHGISEPSLFTLPSQQPIRRLVRRALDQGEGLHMDALLAQSSLLSLKSVSRMLGHRPSKGEDDVLDLSDPTNIFSLDEHAGVQQEQQDEQRKNEVRVLCAAASLLVEMLDLLPEPVVPRRLHEQVMAADLTSLKLSEAYQVLSQLSQTSAAVFMHVCAFLKSYVQSASVEGVERQQLVEQVAVVFSAVMVKPEVGTSPVIGGSAKRRAFVRAFIQ